MHTLKSTLALVIAGLVFSNHPLAGEMVTDPDEVKAIFNGKTVDAHRFKDDESWSNYFAPDGTMQRVTEDGEKDSGVWHINDKAEH
jgi:hypothetical protein